MLSVNARRNLFWSFHATNFAGAFFEYLQTVAGKLYWLALKFHGWFNDLYFGDGKW
jgi:hypothetical protein